VCYLPLEISITEFAADYNNERYHESLENLTPADVYFGSEKEILTEREKNKKITLKQRRRRKLQLFGK